MAVVQPLFETETSSPIPAERPSPLVFADDERTARLRLARSQNVGPRTYMHLLRRFGSARRALEALPELALRGGRGEYEACSVETVQRELDAGEARGAKLVVLGEADYPPMLAQIDPAPPMLWLLGDPALAKKSTIGVVGARNASALGLRTARRISRELATTGHIIVSGLARGIDTAAHEASLGTGTIAVMAGGLDHPYPPENQVLFERIAEEGLLLTEIAFGIKPTGKHFPRRNRIISGLSRGVLLIEAAIRSGSLTTARFAVEQGREAMACPGAPEDPRAAGCNALIREGGALIRHAGDVEEALAAPRTLMMMEEGGEFEFDAELFGDDALRDDYDALADFDEEGNTQDDEALVEQIMSLLGPQPVEIDEIARHCGLSPQELSLPILELDLAGRIEIKPGGMIQKLEPDY